MKVIRDLRVMERAAIFFDLCEAAEEMMRQNIRRRHPELDDSEVERRLDTWYRARPQAPMGDAEGQPTDRFGPIP